MIAPLSFWLASGGAAAVEPVEGEKPRSARLYGARCFLERRHDPAFSFFSDICRNRRLRQDLFDRPHEDVLKPGVDIAECALTCLVAQHPRNDRAVDLPADALYQVLFPHRKRADDHVARRCSHNLDEHPWFYATAYRAHMGIVSPHRHGDPGL